MIRKLLAGGVFALIAVFVAALPVYASQINVAIDGERVNFADQQPANVDGRTLVPVSGVFERLGFEVNWNPDLRQVTLTRTGDTVIITIDNAVFTRNGTNHNLEVPAQIIGGRTMLPIRAVVESVGYEVGWDGAANTVLITTPFDADGFADEFLRLLNKHRAQNGLPPVAVDGGLTTLSSAHARDMLENNLTGVAGSDGVMTVERINNAGLEIAHIAGHAARFNIESAEDIFERWINTAARERAVLEEFVTIAGIAVEIERRDRQADRIYISVKLGRPAITDPALFAQIIFETINEYRRAANLGTLSWDTEITNITNLRLENGLSASGDLTLQWMTTNMTNRQSPESVVSWWMGIDHNRDRVLNPAATRMGGAFRVLPIDQMNDRERGQAIMLMATPTAMAPAAHPFNITNMMLMGRIPQSSITLAQDRRGTDAERQAWIVEFNTMGGVSDFEREVARLVSEVRVSHGLSPVQLDETMVMAARYYSQIVAHLPGGRNPHTTGHNQGPYAIAGAQHGASREVLRAFGRDSRWNGGNAFLPGPSTPQALVDGWMNSDGHRRFILAPEHRYVGPGTSLNAYGTGYSYLFLTNTR
ncbi:MAG: stalk domain-containing protein [Defluviitaleaceae bacterium]|nr:stalk domain-containing protein [Defluviitaleaceae bacterium]